MLSPELFFDLHDFADVRLFKDAEYVWEVLPALRSYLEDTLRPNVAEIRARGDVLQRPYALWQGKMYSDGVSFVFGDPTRGRFQVLYRGEELPGAAALYPGAALLSDEIELGPGCVVEPGALINGPTRIGASTVVRQGAYVRGSCLVGARCVVGHATEMKNAVLLNEAKAGHFAYIGDSILGNDTNLGAGTKLANLKLTPSPFRIRVKDGPSFTIQARKLGAVLGDRSQTGCNSVTNPGTLLGKHCLVLPNVTVPAGYYPSRSLVR